MKIDEFFQEDSQILSISGDILVHPTPSQFILQSTTDVKITSSE